MSQANIEGAGLGAPDAPSRDVIIGSAIAFAFFGLFLGWAALAPLDAASVATGQIVVSGSRQAVQHREGGVVSALRVAEGDQVQRGQILLELASGELRANERGVTGQVLALLAQRSRMIAERDRLSAVPTPPDFNSLAADDQALAQEALRLQRLQFSARGSGRSTERGVLGQRISQLGEQIAGYNSQIASNQAQRRLIEEELEGMRSLAAQGYAPQTRVRALERTAAELDGEAGSLRAQIARANEAIGETRLQMLGVSTRLNEDVAEQLRLVEVQLNELRPRLTALREQLARAEVRAPATGQVLGLTIFTQGGVVQAGQVLMEIVPARAVLVISAEIAPTDADNVTLGQRTEIRFSGLQDRQLPILRGRVERLSADSFTDERTGRTYFRAEVVVPADEMRRLGRAEALVRPGLPVEVVIPSRKRTALAYLLEPLTRNIWRSGRES